MDYNPNAAFRNIIDPREPIRFRLIKPRTDDKKRVPEWALNDNQFKEMLVQAFPHAYGPLARPHDRRRAARWSRIRHLYFKVHLTTGQVVEEMKEAWPDITRKAVERVVERMYKVAAGLSANGRLRRKRGGARPGAGCIRTNVVVTK